MDITDVIQRIHCLHNKEKLHVLNILKQFDKNYTKNSNGYFFNMTDIPENAIVKVKKCLDLIEKNRELIKDMDKRRDELLAYYRSMIEEKLTWSMQERHQKYVDFLTLHSAPWKVTISFKRVLKIKLRQPHHLDADPDDLIKAHVKSLALKYGKNTVHGRLLTKMRAHRSSRNNNNKAKDMYAGMDEASEHGGEDAGEYIAPEIESVDGHVSDEPESIKDDTIPDNQSECESDDFNKTDNDSDCMSVHTDYSNDSETKTKRLKLDDNTQDIQEEVTQTDTDMAFYRRLLNQQGFVFNDTTKVNMVYQAYIE